MARALFDLWEEELAHHYYTRLVQSAALEQGAAWADGLGERERAHRYRTAAREARQGLERYWSEEEGFYCSRISCRAAATKAWTSPQPWRCCTRGSMGPHSVLDPRAQATLHRLEELFAAEYSINRRGHEGRAPALGRYRGDRYYFISPRSGPPSSISAWHKRYVKVPPSTSWTATGVSLAS